VNHRVTTGHGDVYNWQFSHIASGWTGGDSLRLQPPVPQPPGPGLRRGAGRGELRLHTGGAEAFQKRAANTDLGTDRRPGARAALAAIRGIIQKQSPGRIDDNTSNFSYSNLADFQANISNQIQINFPVPF